MFSSELPFYDRSGRRITAREWSELRADGPVHIGDTTIDGARVSTVWLGIDHAWGDGPPIIFETMVFGGELDGEIWRYSTEDQAARGHQLVCAEVRAAQEIIRAAEGIVDAARKTKGGPKDGNE